jgi:diguanylate cyclase (GGDEF)-like protein
MRQILVELRNLADLVPQTREIQNEWNSGIYRKLLFHVYSGLEGEKYTTATVNGLLEVFPDAKIAGTMSAGEIYHGRLMKKGILISALLFETTDVRVLLYDNVRGNESDIGKRVCCDLESIPDIKAAELLLPGTEISTKPLFEEITKCSKDIQIFGGYSGGHMMNAPVHYVFDRGRILYDAIYVITYAGADFHVDIDKVIGWEPLGLTFKVTKADGNRLIELDGKPASEHYEKFLQIDRRLHDNAQEGYTFPLMADRDGEKWLRSAIHIEEDGSLNLHGYVTEGMEIRLSYGNPTTIIGEINERLEEVREFRPQALLIYSCIVRKAFWDRYVDLELEPYEEYCPTSGFYTWGELIRDMNTGEIVEHNVTQLSIAMREGDPAKEELPKARVDDSVLRGTAAQMRRLTSLIGSTMEELQRAQRDLHILNERLREMAEMDALTGLYNRGKTEQLLYKMIDESDDGKNPVSLIMVDIDHFKHINDDYGHQVGDAVLKEVAHLLQDAVDGKNSGIAGRWGGEEFFVAALEMDEPDAVVLAEKLRKTVEEHVFTDGLRLTISLGVITVRGESEYRSIFSRVDRALYDAKEGGRNRVVQVK